ncbi:MAG TPA: hypothetical protein VEB00_07065 [Clostridia bacterium]|nr:hypothetical protein [Clostridia bacterium]
MTHYYYTVASKEYTYKILLLYNSMMRHDKDFKFFIVCLQSDSIKMFESLGLQNAVLIDIEALEAYDGELAAVKYKRSIKQYAWAAKPIAALYILEHHNEVDQIIWLDGDMAFLSSPESIYEEWANYSVLLTEEKFTGKYDYISSIYGYFNTGFMGFRKDENSIECLKYFRNKLLYEWNYEEKEQYRWNDQLYVSDWDSRFTNTGIVKSPGINLTPFIFNRLIEEWNCVLTGEEGQLYIGENRIVLFHFYGFKYFNEKEFDLCGYTNIYYKPQIQYIYLPYIKEAVYINGKLSAIDKSFCCTQPTEGNYIKNYYRLPD